MLCDNSASIKTIVKRKETALFGLVHSIALRGRPRRAPPRGALRGRLIARLALMGALAWLLLHPASAKAAELIMVDRPGCPYCIEWEEKIGPIYPKTEAGAYAPLRHIDISKTPPDDVAFARHVVFTPTFILVEDAKEIGRIEGYPGEDFFWALLEKLLRERTDFDG